MRTILITGGAGYVGSHTALFLAQKGYKIVILDNLTYGQTADFPWAIFVRGDVGNKELLKRIINEHQIDAVIHCAASIDVGKSIYDPLNFYDNNVVKTIALLQTLIAHNIHKVIFSSSCAVYGIPQTIPMAEDHPKNPISPYGMSKLMVEIMLEDARKAHGLNYVALRYFNVAGAMPAFGLAERHEPEIHIIPLLIRAAMHQKPFTIFGTDYATADGTCVRDFIHVWDIAHAHWRALEHLEDGKQAGSFNLGTGTGICVRELIQVVERVMGAPIKTIIGNTRAGDPPTLVADASLAQTVLGWKAQNSELENIIRSAVEAEQGTPRYNFAQGAKSLGASGLINPPQD